MAAATSENTKDIKTPSISIEDISENQIEKIEDSFKHCPESLVVELSKTSEKTKEKPVEKTNTQKEEKNKQ